MIRGKKFIVLVLLCLLLAVASVLPALGEDLGPQLSVSGFGEQGQEVVGVEIELDSVGDVWGIDFVLRYNHQVLQPIKVQIADEVQAVRVEEGNHTQEFFTLLANTVSENHENKDEVRVMIASMSGVPIAGGSGTVAKIYFEVLESAPVGDSDLEFDYIMLSDEDGSPMTSVTAEDGIFTVVEPLRVLFIGSLESQSDGSFVGKPGSTIYIPVSLTNAARTAGIEFKMSYDFGLLEYQGIEPGSITGGFNAVIANYVSHGEVHVMIADTEGKLIQNMKGTVAVLKFKVSDQAKAGQESELRLSDVVLSNALAQEIEPVNTTPGAFKVSVAGGGGGGGGGQQEEELPVIVMQQCTFSDLVRNHWAARDIIALCEAGIVGGYPDGTFMPEKNITRGEFAKIIVGVVGLAVENPSLPSYRDVSRNSWYYGYVEAATKAGLVTGDGKGIFRPDEMISRQEIAVILVRALGKEESVLARADGQTFFADDHAISSWARGYVVIAVEEGLIKGFEDERFRAGDKATRAQSSAMLYRFWTK